MSKKKISTGKWTISLPILDFMHLIERISILEQLEKDNRQLRRELNGLRNLYSELLIRVEELIRLI